MISEPWFLDRGIPKMLDWSLVWDEVIERFADRPCLQLADSFRSFAELGAESSEKAKMLGSIQGWRRGALVILPVQGDGFFARLLAVWRAGGVAVPSNCSNTEHLLVEADFLWNEDVPKPGKAFQDLPSLEWHAVYFTSGSTGLPRAVVRGWGQALYEAGHYAAVLGLRPEMSCSSLIHPSFGAFTKHFLGCLLSGCCQSFPGVSGSCVPGTHLLYGTPSQIVAREAELMFNKGYGLISLTGEPCSPKAWSVIRSCSAPGAMCLNALGGTETGVLINSITEVNSSGDSESGLIGSGLSGKRLVILDDNGCPVSAGIPGRLCVESRWIAEGYLDSSSSGECMFSPFDESGSGRFFVTGDVAVEEAGGVFRHLGRSGSMIKHRGEWTDTSRLISVLTEEGISEFHLDISVETGGLLVWIRMDCPRSEALKRIASRLSEALEDSPALPEFLVAVSEFPMTPRGKTDLRKLRKLHGTLTERIPTRAEMMAAAILRGESHVPALKGAIRIADLNLDSLSLHELLLELERRSDYRITSERISPGTILEEISRGLTNSGGFSRLGGKGSSAVLLWIGDGVAGIHKEFGNDVTIMHWNVAEYPGADETEDVRSLRELSERMLAKADMKELEGGIVVGGYSAGALLAQEISRVLADRGITVDGMILLDPPDLDCRAIRSGWRWSRWRPAILLALLGIVPRWIVFRSGKIRRALGREKVRYVRERRRKLIKEHRVVPSIVPAILATSGSNHEAAVRNFGRVSERTEILSLGVEDHISVISNPESRVKWMEKLRTLLLRADGVGRENALARTA